MSTPAPRRRLGWLWLALLLGAVVATVPFWLTDLDLRAAAHFYHPAPAELGRDASWPLGQSRFYGGLYTFGSALSWLVLLGSILTFAVPKLRRRPLLRQVALTTLATVALGTGLLVNGLGKDFTGRPRPRTLVEFGGHAQYRPPLDLGTPGVGKSFPCGHCSAGFAVGAVGLAVLAARPALGLGIIAASFVLGGAIGSARMAAGGHFLSDVLWSAILTWIAALTAHALLQRARDAHARNRWPPWLRYGALGALMLAVVGGLLYVRPFQHDVRFHVAPADLPAALVLDLDVADLDVRVDAAAKDAVRLDGQVKGFGFPNVRVRESDARTATTWTHALRQTGTTKEIDAPMTLVLRPDTVGHIDVRIGTGSVRLPAGPDAAALQPRIHVRTADVDNN